MIEIDNRQIKFDVTETTIGLINMSIDYTLKHEGFDAKYEVSVVITDNGGIKEFNSQYRGINSETDVLSFPMLVFSTGIFVKGISSIDIEDINPETDSVLLGDVVISIEKAYSQANDYGHSPEREIAFLIVHSMLHLLGHDHEEERDRILMRNKEEDIMEKLNLSRA